MCLQVQEAEVNSFFFWGKETRVNCFRGVYVLRRVLKFKVLYRSASGRKSVKICVKRAKKMKAIAAVCATGASVPAIANGRVQRHRDGENAEIQMYLSKLKDLVPFMPKNRKISKLEVIQNVIDYICDLQSALESHPAVNTFDPVQALASHQSSAEPMESTPVGPRQPLGVRPSPNTILANLSNATNSAIYPVNGSSSSSSSSEATSIVVSVIHLC